MNNNNKLIENFLETIHAERNASHNTLLAYRRDLEAFVYFLSKKRINTKITKMPILRIKT